MTRQRMGRAGARAKDASDPRRGGKPGKSGERLSAPSRPGKPSRPDKAAKFGKPERAGKPERFAKPERAGKPERFAKLERAGKPERFGKAEKSDRPEKFGKKPFGKKPFGEPVHRADGNERPQGRHRPDSRAASFRKDHDARAERRPPPAPLVEPPKPVAPQVSSGVQTVTVSADETGMRLDRFFETRFPGLPHSYVQRIVRKGEVRVNGKRVDTKDRLEMGQQVRVPPLRFGGANTERHLSADDEKTRAFLKSITLYQDADVMVLNKPMGLAVQGGSGTTRHVDGMLEVLRQPGVDGQKPRLVHRLDKDTAGCLLIAKTRFAAAALAKSFRSRSARKIYWALTAGVPKPRQGRISTYLAKEQLEEDSFMRVAQHGDEGASHAVTYYAVVEASGSKLAWVSLKPVTGRTHQLRAHMAHVGNPIVGDPKYFQIENWELPGGLQNKLHLVARRLAVPHPRGGVIDVTAPLPPHMLQSWNLLGLEADRYDPIVEAPEED